MSFAACLPVILASEGGYTNNPADSGGPTSLGVTIPTLSQWLGHPAGVADVDALTPTTVAPLYEALYWRAAACDGCPAGVDLMVFDAAVNQGVGRAVRLLQTALGLPADGIVGPLTRSAASACNAAAVINAIADARERLYRSYPKFAVFGGGWMTRLARTRADALQMVV